MNREAPLSPKQALRLCALGELMQHGALTYGDLAERVRDFANHLVGPTLDMMGGSLELLRYDGLIEPIDDAPESEARLSLTEDGRKEFSTLMEQGLSTPFNETVKLVVTLKLRFLHLLPADRRQARAAALTRVYEQEAERLRDLRARYAGESEHLGPWLDHDIAQYERRVAWFQDLARRLQE